MTLSKSEQTRIAILEEAMVSFNKKGYAGTHIRDIAGALSMTQGAIYGNFKNKDELALESFRRAYRKVGQALWEYVDEAKDHSERLHRFVSFFERYLENPVVPGGCPMLNTAVEADDYYIILKEEVKVAFGKLQRFFGREVKAGQEAGQFRTDIDAAYYAGVIIALIEGTILLCRIDNNQQLMHNNLRFMGQVIDTQIKL